MNPKPKDPAIPLLHIEKVQTSFGIGNKGKAVAGCIEGVEFILIAKHASHLNDIFHCLRMDPIDHSRTRDVAVLPLESVTLK